MTGQSACLGLGSNSDAASNLARALAALRRADGVEVVAVSGAWEFAAVGVVAPDYLNAAVLVRTPLPRDDLKARLLRIEAALGRVRVGGPTPLVPIDIDLLTFGADVLTPDLWGLAYRCVPAAEVLPDLASATTGETLAQAARRLSESLKSGRRVEDIHPQMAQITQI